MAARSGRVVWLLAVAAAVTSLVVVAPKAASAQQTGFLDVTSGVHEPAIDVLAEQGLFEGTLCGDGMFCPGEPVTRATAAVWLIRALGDGAPAVRLSRFTDVDADEWWARYVERLAELDIASGCEADPLRFCPDEEVTRARMASWLAHAFELEEAPPAAFSDVEGNAHEADIAALAAAGIAVGCERDPLRFCPDDAVTRAQLASFLARALGLLPPPAEFTWSLPSHCSKYSPSDPHAAPEDGCPAWWSHLLDLEPSSEGITVAEMEARLKAALPYHTPKIGDNLASLTAPTRELIAATLASLATGDPRTAAQMHTISAQPNRCPESAVACALLGGINFGTPLGNYRWLTVVGIIVHEWVHNRDFGTAPGGIYATQWCDRMATRLSVAESTGRLVTHMGLLEAASPAHQASLVTRPGCAEALIARFSPEVGSHDRPGFIAELSANAQTQAWMRRGYASAEARWWAAEAAAGYPTEPQPLATPLTSGPAPETPAEPVEPGDCNDGMHEHPYLEDARHYHSDGLEPHEHHRRHILVDGVALPSDTPEPAGTHCEYPDGRRAISAWSWNPDTRPGDPVFVHHRSYSPDGQWYAETVQRCVDITTPAHPGHDPSPERHDLSARHRVCDQRSDLVWLQCGSSRGALPCPTEEHFADGEYNGDWVACGEAQPGRLFDDICRKLTRQPRAR